MRQRVEIRSRHRYVDDNDESSALISANHCLWKTLRDRDEFADGLVQEHRDPPIVVTNDTVTNDTDHHDPSIEGDRDIGRNSGDDAVVPSTFSTNVREREERERERERESEKNYRQNS